MKKTALPVLITSIPPSPIGEAAARPHPDDGAVAGPRRAPTGASDRILLVEDNPVNQRVSLAMLENLGFCVDVVDNGVEAVIAATMVPYRAILMDCQIPVLNGFDATSEIRDQWGASRNSPIIAVSSSATEEDQKRGAAAGMNGFLAKPLSVAALAAGMALWAPDPASPDPAPQTLYHGPPTHPGQAPPPDVDRPVFDPEVTERLERLGAASGEDLMGQLATLFLADADSRMVALRQALEDGDGPALMLEAHTLCGASANLGAVELSHLCARLTTDGAVGDPERGEALLLGVEIELERVRLALSAPTPPPPTSRSAPELSSSPTPSPRP